MPDDSTSPGAITSAGVKFPRTGTHIFHLGDQVTFTDKLARVHTGPITKFERIERYTHVTVTTEHGAMLIELRRVLPAELPEAVALAAAGTPGHLVAGTLVRVTLKGKALGGINDGDLAVVIADKGPLVNVARLGGHQDSYARLSHASLTVVTVDPRTAALSE
jgi:hypothetical protein